MKEDFLHYLWKYQLYKEPLILSTGDNVEIISVGESNGDAGPDFFNAKIQYNNTIWAGNVEIHKKASDWIKHGHQNDEAYNNIILHVVAENDCEIKRKNGNKIPTVELKCPDELYKQFIYLMQNKNWVPCESFIKKIDEFTILQWKEALLVERLALKSKIVAERFVMNNKNWEETFYQTLAYNFGLKVNSEPFELLAKSTPLRILAKHKDQLPLIEAILFGQAGLLPEVSEDSYVRQLLVDYKHFSHKYSLKQMSGHLWKFMRLRPHGFPTVKVAVFAALIHESMGLFSRVLESKSIDELSALFDVKSSEYWNTHYTFNKESHKKEKGIGRDLFNSIVINTIAPVLFYYSQQKSDNTLSERLIDWLLKLPQEENSITKGWIELGLEIKNAFDSQALIQLKNVYCKNRRCLNCRIGNKVIKYTY